MDFKEVKSKSANELRRMLAEERATLYDLRLKMSVNQLKDVRSIRKTRGNIAQILTRLNQLNKEAPAQIEK